MAIREKVTREDMILFEIIRHPTLLGEFLRNVDTSEREKKRDGLWEYTDYQKEFICDFNALVALCCGRSVGKTVAITDILIWLLINKVFPGDYVVYTVPNKVHLTPVWDNLVRMFRGNSILSQFLQRGKGINASDHIVRLLTNMSLDCRIAGTTGTEAPVVGMHTPFEVIDEAGLYPWGTWIGLQPTLNTWQKGKRRIVSGVPTGLREKNVLYYADMVDDGFSTHRISAHRNPRYSAEVEEENLKKYGGVDGEDYIHHVLGRHGKPSYSVFDRSLMQIKQYPVYKMKLSGLKIDTMEEYFRVLSTIPKVEPPYDYLIAGVDLGYTEPTAIHIMYAKNGVFYWHARIQLTKVPYPIQKVLFDWLDERFGRFDIIGMDAGHAGKSVTQDLLQDDRYLHKDYEKRLIPVEFSANMILGIDADGEEIKTKLKPFSVSLTQEYTNAHKLTYSSTDLEFVTELERMTYQKTPRGDIVYKTLTPKGGEKGEDHHTAALLCAMVAHYTLRDQKIYGPRNRKLAKFSWSAS